MKIDIDIHVCDALRGAQVLIVTTPSHMDMLQAGAASAEHGTPYISNLAAIMVNSGKAIKINLNKEGTEDAETKV